MAFITHKGAFVTDPAFGYGRIILTHPDCPHSLVLFCVSDESGYLGQVSGWKGSDGRSNTGGIRIAGGTRNPTEELQCSFLVSESQIQIFDWLKRLNDTSPIPITCQDLIQKVIALPGATTPAWASGWPINNDFGIPEGYQSFPAWIDTDAGYKTPQSGTLWWLLQFQALREI
jgi:hypothetical protein